MNPFPFPSPIPNLTLHRATLKQKKNLLVKCFEVETRTDNDTICDSGEFTLRWLNTLVFVLPIGMVKWC